MLDLAQQIFEVVDGHQLLLPAKFIEMMGLNIDSFALNAHGHRDTIARSTAAESIQSHSRTTLQVLAVSMNASGGDLQAAIFWYRNEPFAAFDHKTAELPVAEGRASDVLDLLGSYQAGFVG